MKPAERSDVLEAPRFLTEPGVTYVIDRGYEDFQLFDQRCHDDIFFATRLKSNTVVDIRDLIYDDLEQNGFRESLVIIGSAQKKMDNHLRLVKFYDDTGKLYQIVTNRFDLSAKDISEFYRFRWQIELIFKWMKQHLQVNNIHG